MFEKLLIKIAKEFDNNSIPYMIIGGQAVLLYGEPRLTKDIDITLGISVNELNTILGLIKKIKLVPLPKNVKNFTERTFVLPTKDEETSIRVDFIFSQTSYEKQAIKRVNLVNLKDTILKFASLEDVIIHKLFAGRPRDLEDAKSIMLKNPNFDKSYIKKWLIEFDRATGEKKFVNSLRDLIKK
jgi:hypothetical protein